MRFSEFNYIIKKIISNKQNKKVGDEFPHLVYCLVRKWI